MIVFTIDILISKYEKSQLDFFYNNSDLVSSEHKEHNFAFHKSLLFSVTWLPVEVK